jgi:hypothetical protein
VGLGRRDLTLHSCGPYKLAYILNQCLDRFDSPEENIQQGSPSIAGIATGSPHGRRKALQSANFITSIDVKADPALVANVTTASDAPSTGTPVSLPLRHVSSEPQVMIVDDNPINRSVSQMLSALPLET